MGCCGAKDPQVRTAVPASQPQRTPPAPETKEPLQGLKTLAAADKSKEYVQACITPPVNIKAGVADCIGGTPLLRLNRIPATTGATVVLKMEGENPGKSVKDRLALGMIRDLEAAGEIAPGKTTLIEATSGNTGVALAMLGAAKGYKVILTMPEQMSMERRVVLRSYGAEVVLTPKTKGLKGALIKAKWIEDEINQKGDGKNAVQPFAGRVTWQFETDSNARIHKETTGPEIWKDTGGKVDYVVSGVGTGGTITGVAQYIKAQGPGGSKCKFVAVEPAESAAMTHHREGKAFKPGPHKVQGMGAGFIPNTLDMDLVDEVIAVPSADAISMSRRMPKEEGVLAGISAGAILAAAMRVAERAEAAGKTIVAICPSQGERYLSTDLFSELSEQCKNLPVVGEDWYPEGPLKLDPPQLIPQLGPFKTVSSGIRPDISGMIGNTPLVALNKVTGGLPGRVLAKLESENPGKSVKDRLGWALIADAEAAGLAAPGKTTIIEATSGNTGVALAMIGASKGYKVILVMPDTMSQERRVVMASFGAEVVLTTAKKGLVGARYKAQELAKEIKAKGGDAIISEQFENLSNALIHKQTTGPEIYLDCGKSVDYIVSGVGTGGTVTGIAQYLKEQGCNAKIVAVEPAESAAMTAKRKGDSAFKPSPHKIQGMGAGFIPNAMDLGCVDEIIPVSSDDALAMSRRLATEEGLLSGISSGAIVAAARRIAGRKEAAGKKIVAIIPSAGERYLSSALFLPLFEECKAMKAIPESEYDDKPKRGEGQAGCGLLLADKMSASMSPPRDREGQSPTGKESRGLHVEQLIAGGAAEQAGLKVQDVLLAVRNLTAKEFGDPDWKEVEINEQSDFRNFVASSKPNDVALLRITRGDEELEVKMTFGFKSAASSRNLKAGSFKSPK